MANLLPVFAGIMPPEAQVIGFPSFGVFRSTSNIIFEDSSIMTKRAFKAVGGRYKKYPGASIASLKCLNVRGRNLGFVVYALDEVENA